MSLEQLEADLDSKAVIAEHELKEKELCAEVTRLQAELAHYRDEAVLASITAPMTSCSLDSSSTAPLPDEIIRLNVGGVLFTTLRSTLCSVPGSMLEAMFSGRFGSPAMRDSSGAYFLDRDPEYFGFVLSYLRDPRNRPVARASHSRLAILREFEYFGLLPDAGVYVAEPGSSIACVHHLELSYRFSSMSVFGSRAYVSTETHVELWCLNEQRCITRLKLDPGVLVRGLEATATRCFVLCGEGDIQVWDAELKRMLKRVEPKTGWVTQFQVVHDLYDSSSSSASSFANQHQPTHSHNGHSTSTQQQQQQHSSNQTSGNFGQISANSTKKEERRSTFPKWRFSKCMNQLGASGGGGSGIGSGCGSNGNGGGSNGHGTNRLSNRRSLLFFDGDSGVYALDLDTLSISTVIELEENDVLMAFHVSGEELYFATERTLNSFNLFTCKRALLSSTSVEFKRIRAIENDLLVCWDTMGDQLVHFDLRTRNWTSPTPSDRWHPLSEQCEVFRSLVVGRDFRNRIVLWCTSPLIEEEISEISGNFSGSLGNRYDSSSSHFNVPSSLHSSPSSSFSQYSLMSSQSCASKQLRTKVIPLFNDPTPSASSYFFQFQGSSIVVATSSPIDISSMGANGANGANGMDNARPSSLLPSGSIRVFNIRR